MIVRQLEDVVGTPRDVRGSTWSSRRLLLADDQVGFSVHDTVIDAGTTTEMWYKHHVEAVYCIEGRGRLLDRETGTEHPLGPGTLYVLDGHERHTVHADSQLRMVCVFSPPCTGQETHDDEGTYPLLYADGAPA